MAKLTQFVIPSAVVASLKANNYSVRDTADSVKAAIEKMQRDGGKFVPGKLRLTKKFAKYGETERLDFIGNVNDSALRFGAFCDAVSSLSEKWTFEVTLPAESLDWLAQFKMIPAPTPAPAPTTVAPTA